jgi:hypothetical protein
MTSSSNTFGALNVGSQYAPSEMAQPANSHQRFTIDSRQPMQSCATPKAQATISNGFLDNGGHEYLGNMSTPYPSQEQSFMRQNESYIGFRARYQEQAPNAESAADIPQTLFQARHPPTGSF